MLSFLEMLGGAAPNSTLSSRLDLRAAAEGGNKRTGRGMERGKEAKLREREKGQTIRRVRTKPSHNRFNNSNATSASINPTQHQTIKYGARGREGEDGLGMRNSCHFP